MKKSELVERLEKAFDEMERGTQRTVFGGLFKEYTKKERTAGKAWKKISDMDE